MARQWPLKVRRVASLAKASELALDCDWNWLTHTFGYAGVKDGRIDLGTVGRRLDHTAVLIAGRPGYEIARVTVLVEEQYPSLRVRLRRDAAVRLAAVAKRLNVGSGGGSDGDDQARRASTPAAAASDAGSVAEGASAIPPQTRED